MSTVADVIEWARRLALRDFTPPYLWEDEELIYCLNRAFNELIKLPITRDQTTESVVQIELVSNLGVYPYDSSILQILDARLETNATYGSLNRTSEEYLNKTRSDWRSLTGTPTDYIPGAYAGYLSVYPKFDDTGEITDALTFDDGTTTISGADFSGISAGERFLVSGTTYNNGYKTASGAGTTTSIVVTEALTDETYPNAVIQPVRDTLLLSVNKLRSTRFSVGDIETATEITELRADRADGLVEGIAKRAFLKPGSNTYDRAAADRHKAEFELFKREIRRDLILFNKPDKSRKPRSGTSIWY